MPTFTDPLQIAATAFGLFVGVIYGLSGFRDDAKSSDLSKNPRVKNLQWAVAGLVGIVIGDIKAVASNPAPEERAILTSEYLCGLLAGAVGVISISAIAIYFVMKTRARHNPALVGRTGDAVLEYLQYGFAAYRSRTDKLEADAISVLRNGPTSLGEFGQALGAVLSASHATTNGPMGATERDAQIDRALLGMESVVKLFGSGEANLQVETNFMLVVSRNEMVGEQVLFTENRSLNEFASFLALKRYRTRPAGSVHLPVERTERVQRILPGAPLAAAETRACCINTRKPEFRSGVSRRIRKEIETFFKAVTYASALSIPILRGREVVAVVNVETNRQDVVGKGAGLVPEIGRALAPLCVIMGESIEKAGVDHV